MKSDNPAVTDPALEVIRANDPDTWKRMVRDGLWDVHVLEPSDENSYDVIVRQSPTIMDYFATMAALNSSALGLTPHDRDHPWTDLNMPLLREFAEETGTTVAVAVASVLVHEFAHHERQTGETAAFQAEISFDRKLGIPALIADRIEVAQIDPARYNSVP